MFTSPCLVTIVVIILLSGTHLGARSAHDDDFVCPYKQEETLYYNIDIMVEGIGENCGSYDLYSIGATLQEVVDEVEEEIPEYKATERMETNVCLLPVELEERRTLQETTTRANRRRKKGTYTYKGGGRCRRCRKSNSDRRLGSAEVCNRAGIAAQAAEQVSFQVKQASSAFSLLKERALECSDLDMGFAPVSSVKALLAQIRKKQKVANKASKQAKQDCQKSRKVRTSKEMDAIVKRVNTASGQAVNAANSANNIVVQIGNSLGGNICNQAGGRTFGSSAQASCREADAAVFYADMASAAVESTTETIKVMNNIVPDCDDWNKRMTGANSELQAANQARNVASKKAKQAKRDCKNTKKTNKVKMLRQQAKNEASKARGIYFALREDVKILNCDGTIGRTRQPHETNEKNAGTTSEIQETAAGGYYTGGTGREKSMLSWIAKLVNMLYEKIPGRVMEAYSQTESTLGECELEGFRVTIDIHVLDTGQEVEDWITLTDCANLKI